MHPIPATNTSPSACCVRFAFLLQKPPAALTERLLTLQGDIDFDDLVRYRVVAAARVPKVSAKEKGGWFSGWFGGGGNKHSKAKHKDHDDTTISEEQKRQIYGAIGYHEGGGDYRAEATSAGYVAMQASLTLTMLQLSLTAGRRRGQPGPGSELVAVKAYGFELGFGQRPVAEAVSVAVKLERFMVVDGTAADPASLGEYDLIVQPRKAAHHRLGVRSPGADSSEPPFFRLAFETNPLDHSADSAVTMEVQPVEIVYRPLAMARLGEFFAPPPGLVLEDVSNAAGKQAFALATQTTTGLKYAIEQHKTLNLNLNVGAPTVVIPAEAAGVTLVVDLGHLSVVSELQPKDAASIAQFEESMYDRFRVTLEDVQGVIVGAESKATWREALESGRAHHLLEPMLIELRVMQCVQQDNFAFARLKLHATLPSLRLRLSDRKYRFLMALADELGPSAADVGARPADIESPAAARSNQTPAKRASRAPRSTKKKQQAGSNMAGGIQGGTPRTERSVSMRSTFSEADEFYSADEGDSEVCMV